jgi:hypothetical protein
VPEVRNGNRWRVAHVNLATNHLAAERLDDGARALFDNDYLREHVNLDHAVIVLPAQGVTANTSHANTAHLYERASGVEQRE